MIVQDQSTQGGGIIPHAPEADDKFSREQRAFYRLLGSLLESHKGQYVAIHEGRVVASGSDLVEVALRAYAEHGRQPIYVDLVAEHPLPPIRHPHYRQVSRHQ